MPVQQIEQSNYDSGMTMFATQNCCLRRQKGSYLWSIK